MDTLQRFQRQSREENRGRRGQSRRYSQELRGLALRYRAERAESGAGVERVADELGISGQTLRNWLRPTVGGFRQVEVVAERAARDLVLVTPGGCRIEGLGLEDVAALLGGTLA